MCILYFFHTSWCGKCKEFDKKLSVLHSPYLVDVDAESCSEALLNSYKISMLPTFVLVDNQTDNMIDKLEQPSSFEELCDWFKLKTGKELKC